MGRYKSFKKLSDGLFILFYILGIVAGLAAMVTHRVPVLPGISFILIFSVILIGHIYNEQARFPSLHAYINLMIGEIPNILQILTFAGFIVILFRHNTSATMVICAFVGILNNLYLNQRQHKYISGLASSGKVKSELSEKFLVFNLMFVTILLIALYPVIKYILKTE